MYVMSDTPIIPYDEYLLAVNTMKKWSTQLDKAEEKLLASEEKVKTLTARYELYRHRCDKLTQELNEEKERVNAVVVEAKQYISARDEKLVTSKATIRGLKKDLQQKDRQCHEYVNALETQIERLKTTLNEYIEICEGQKAMIFDLQSRLPPNEIPPNEINYKL